MRMSDGKAEITGDTVQSDQDFEKLILAYDYAIRRNSRFAVDEEKTELIDNGRYQYPKLTFTKK